MTLHPLCEGKEMIGNTAIHTSSGSVFQQKLVEEIAVKR